MELGMSLCVKNRVILSMCVIFLCIVYSSVYVTLNITVTGVNFPPQIHTIAL